MQIFVGDFIGPEYSADPQADIVEGADLAHVTLGYAPTLRRVAPA